MIKVLFLGRNDCVFSNKVFLYLRKIKNIKTIYYKVDLNNLKIIKKKISRIKKNNFDYLISFRSHLILKKSVLDKIKFNSINFHPGTPKYRGIGCVNFALLNNEKIYGSTCHLIDRKIDNGTILDVKYFSIKKTDSVNVILNRTYKTMTLQAQEMIKKVLIQGINPEKIKKKKIKWSKKLYTRTMLDDLYNIDINVSKNLLNRILKACVTKKFKPYVKINNKKFFYLNR